MSGEVSIPFSDPHERARIKLHAWLEFRAYSSGWVFVIGCLSIQWSRQANYKSLTVSIIQPTMKHVGGNVKFTTGEREA